jgi:hypothetical protein
MPCSISPGWLRYIGSNPEDISIKDKAEALDPFDDKETDHAVITAR